MPNSALHSGLFISSLFLLLLMLKISILVWTNILLPAAHMYVMHINQIWFVVAMKRRETMLPV